MSTWLRVLSAVFSSRLNDQLHFVTLMPYYNIFISLPLQIQPYITSPCPPFQHQNAFGTATVAERATDLVISSGKMQMIL